MNLSGQQKDALSLAEAWHGARRQPVFYLAGYAGTGKTTIAKELTALLGGRWVYCAYTGKAALVMRQNGCPDATTIHQAIYTSKGDAPEPADVEALREEVAGLTKELENLPPSDKPGVDFKKLLIRDRLSKVQAQLRAKTGGRKGRQPMFTKKEDATVVGAAGVIVDECSMAGRRISDDLTSYGVPVLALGDPAQLPPVGDGGGFTSREPNFTLTEVHRQARDSGILRLATEVRTGRRPALGDVGPDCRVRSIRDYTRDQLADLATGADQIIVGRNATRRAWNHSMRERLGLAQGEHPRHPVAGDRIVCLRTDYDAGVLNGSQWKVLEADCQEETMRCLLKIVPLDHEGAPIEAECHLHHFVGREDDLKPSEHRQALEFTYAYAVTCHKAQGSQWGRVLVVDESATFRDDWWRHLYTAATRAQRDLTVLTIPTYPT